MAILRLLRFAGCFCCDDGDLVLLLRVLLGVPALAPRLTGVLRRFEAVVVFDVDDVVRLGDFLPVENGAATGAGGGDEGGVVVVAVVFLVDAASCCCRRLSRHAFARALAASAASFLDFFADVARSPPSSSLAIASAALRFFGGIVFNYLSCLRLRLFEFECSTARS